MLLKAATTPEGVGYRAASLVKTMLGPLVSVLGAFLGLMVIIFFIGRVLPIDPVLTIVGDQADAQTYQQVSQELGLDRPLIQQFSNFVSNAAAGDFGRARLTGNLVLTDLIKVFPATIELATTGILIGALLGIPLGVIAAVNRGRATDNILRIVMLMGH